MEDLSNYAVLRKELIAGRVDKVAVQRIAEHIGAVHNATHVYNMEASSFQDLVKRYRYFNAQYYCDGFMLN